MQQKDDINIETFRPFFPITCSNWVSFIQYHSKSAFMRLENSWYIEPLLSIFRIEMYIFSTQNTSKLSGTYANHETQHKKHDTCHFLFNEKNM